MAALALPRRRGGRLRRPGGAGTTGRKSLSHASRDCACHVAWVPRRRGKVPCGETRGAGDTPVMLAGRTGGTGMVGERLPPVYA